jgi:hypothetical protein
MTPAPALVSRLWPLSLQVSPPFICGSRGEDSRQATLFRSHRTSHDQPSCGYAVVSAVHLAHEPSAPVGFW